EVYYETGFENLSHFSYAFKKHFGYAPTRLIQDK
ncbi:MAG: AraC family transcriptional regulator, partial [Flavobacterium sp.]